jgi:hypothetical protein
VVEQKSFGDVPRAAERLIDQRRFDYRDAADRAHSLRSLRRYYAMLKLADRPL